MAHQTPDWLARYELTPADRLERARMSAMLMADHDQALLYATRSFSAIYREEMGSRDKITDPDPEDYAWVWDHKSGIIDRIVGGALVVLQGEIDRLTQIVGLVDGDKLTWEKRIQLRATGSTLIGKHSDIEILFQFANFFKHDSDHARASAQDELTNQQRHTRDVLSTFSDLEAPLMYHPGSLEKAVAKVFGISIKAGFDPMYQCLAHWREQLVFALEKQPVA